MRSTDDPRWFPFPPAIPVVALVLSWGLGRIWPIEVPWSEWSRWLGWLLFTLPYLLTWRAITTFRHRNTVIDPRGVVATIVEVGPFRYSRNPMYLALLLSYVGGTLALRLPWALALLAPVFFLLHFGVIVPEERYLESRFGEAYLDYKKRVPRWFGFYRSG